MQSLRLQSQSEAYAVSWNDAFAEDSAASCLMKADSVDALTTLLSVALREAYATKGLPSPALESMVRALAQAKRERGDDIARVIVETKALVRETTADYEPVFTPKIVGWTVAGYFHGTAPQP